MIVDHLDLAAFADQPYCDLTTTGRRSGSAHTIEIWFATDGERIYLISGGGDRSDWVRNLLADPRCRIDLRGPDAVEGVARLPLPDGAERRRAIALLHPKYASQVSGSVAAWEADAYLVGIDLAYG